MKQFQLIIEDTGAVLAERAALADNPWTRMKGLLGRRGLEPGEAIILHPCSSIHTMFMRFALDVVFLDKDQKVMKVARRLEPFRLAGARGAREAVEMQGGSLDDVDLKPGSRIVSRALR